MPESLPKDDEIDRSGTNEDLSSLKFLLGDFGIQILSAIAKGARTVNAIMTLSGVPLACVHGRTPVLKNLNLIKSFTIDHFEITEKGLNFLKSIRNRND